MKPWEQYQQQPESKPWEQYQQPKPAQSAAPSAPYDVWDDMTGMEKFGVGVAKPFVELYHGARQLFGREPTEEDLMTLARLQAVRGAAGTTGEVVGNIAAYAMPGGAAMRGAQMASRALPRALSMAAPAGADIAASAGVEALKAPTDNRSRGEAAMEGAAGALVGQGIGKVLTKAVGGVKIKPEARQMLDEGIPLTPGQASAGSFLPWAEKRLSYVPGVAGKVAKHQRTAQEAWNLNLLNHVAPPGNEISAVGTHGFQQVQDGFRSAYGALWKAVDAKAINPQVDNMLDMGKRAAQARMGKDAAADIGKMLDNVKTDLALARAGDHSAEYLSRIDDTLRDAASKARRDGEVVAADIYSEVRKVYRNSLPDKVSATLTDLDSRYRKFAVLQRAASYKGAVENKGVFSPSDLTAAVRGEDKSAGKRAVAAGRAAMQPEAAQATEVIGGLVPRSTGLGENLTIPAVAAGMYVDPLTTTGALAAGRGLVSKPVRNLLLGEYKEPALVMAEQLRKYTGATPRRIGAGVASAVRPEEQEEIYIPRTR